MFDSILNTSMFADIEIKNPEHVLSKFTERHYGKDHILFWQGEPGTEMYVIKSGSLKIFSHSEGKELILGHQFPGETIGELEVVHAKNLRLASVATLEKSVLWVIRKADLDDLISLYPMILRKLFYVVSERLEQADRKLEYLSFLDTRIRVANLLLDLHTNFGVETEEGYFINWKATHQHLAQMIGVTRESMTVSLRELVVQQVIQIKNRQITILNLSILSKLARDEHREEDTRKWHPSNKYSTR